MKQIKVSILRGSDGSFIITEEADNEYLISSAQNISTLFNKLEFIFSKTQASDPQAISIPGVATQQ